MSGKSSAWLLRGVIDSPPDQSESLKRLNEIERELRSRTMGTCLDFAAREAELAMLSELWDVVLDVVCSPLWVRIRAAELLNVCFVIDGSYLSVTQQNSHWMRSIVSSTCHVLDAMDPRDKTQAEQISTWLQFLENMLSATRSEVFVRAFKHSTYAVMLTKMLRLLCFCSTKLFAATIMCMAAFYAHETQVGNNVLLQDVLSQQREGSEHVGGALLHVINSCGFPCADNRRPHLCNCLQLLGDCFTHPQASRAMFVNDFKVLIDIIIRECTDLPLEDLTRVHYLVVLHQALGTPFFVEAQFYRKIEILKVLESLLDAGADEDLRVPSEVFEMTKAILLERIDLLD